MKSRQLKFAIFGAGWPGRMHAQALAGLRNVRVVAVADPDAERRRAVMELAGAMREYDDYTSLIADGDVDGAIVALPTGMHADAVTAAIRAGLHVLCEKPPTATAAQMIRIARLVKEKKVTYAFCRQPRFTAPALEARRLVAAGRIGEVYHADTRYIRCRGIPLGAGGWFVNKAKGGGVLLDLGIHTIDDAWFAMGCPRPVEASAGLHCAFDYLAPKGVEYTAEDAALGLIRFEGGATLTFMTTFALNTAPPENTPSKETVNPAWLETRVYGTRGGVDVTNSLLILGRKDGVRVKPFRDLP